MHLGVDLGTDAAYGGTTDPGLAPERLHQLVHLPRRGAGAVGGHDHRPQGLVDLPTGFQEAREERSAAQLGDAQLDVAGRRGQQAVPATVSLVGTGLGSLVALGADSGGQLGVDQLLESPLEQPSEQVTGAAVTQSFHQVGNSGIIIVGHRVIS